MKRLVAAAVVGAGLNRCRIFGLPAGRQGSPRLGGVEEKMRQCIRTITAVVGTGLVVLVLLSVPSAAQAQTPPAAPGTGLALPDAATQLPALPALFHDLEGSFGKIWDMVVTAAAIVFMVLLLIGGIQYLTAAGNEESTKKARALLLDAVIGLVLVLLAWPIGRYAIEKLQLGNITISDNKSDSRGAGGGATGSTKGAMVNLSIEIVGAADGEQFKAITSRSVTALLTNRQLVSAQPRHLALTSKLVTSEQTFTTKGGKASILVPADANLLIVHLRTGKEVHRGPVPKGGTLTVDLAATITDSIRSKVRVAVLDQTKTSVVSQLEVTAATYGDLVTGVTDAEGHAELLLLSGATYTLHVNPRDATIPYTQDTSHTVPPARQVADGSFRSDTQESVFREVWTIFVHPATDRSAPPVPGAPSP